MVDNFKLEYDRVNSLSAPGLEDSEILTFLDRAQYALADQLFFQKQWNLLYNADAVDVSLLKTCSYAKGAGWVTRLSYDSNCIEVSLLTGTTRFWYYINSYLSLTRTAVPEIVSAKVVKTENIIKDQVTDFIASGVNTPIFRFPKAFQDGDDLIIMMDSYTVPGSALYVDYMSKPSKLVLSAPGTGETIVCELHPSTHEEIITRAVQLAQITTNPQMAEANIKLTNA